MYDVTDSPSLLPLLGGGVGDVESDVVIVVVNTRVMARWRRGK